jgi:hypothetical protein
MLVSRIFANSEDATTAINALKEAGFGEERVRIIDKSADQTDAPYVTSKGVSDVTRAQSYADGIGAGKVLVIVDAPLGTTALAKEILEHAQTGDNDTAVTAYEEPYLAGPSLSGEPQKFDPTAPAPLSAKFGWPVLLDNPTPLSSYLKWKTLSPPPTTKPMSHGLPFLSPDPTPLSSYFKLKTLSPPPTEKPTSHGLPFLSDDPTPLSSRAGWKVLLDNATPFSSWIGKSVLSNNPTPLSSWLNIPVLSGKK